MSQSGTFNAAVCVIGIAIILIHIINLLLKKIRRPDENRLLVFLSFTAFHLATYLTFSLVRIVYTSDGYIIGFYTAFYIFNNVEAFLFFLYMLCYVELSTRTRKTLAILNVSVFALFVILDIVNIFAKMFFTAENGQYVRANTMIVAQIYQFVMLAIVFFVTLFNARLVVREKVAFGFYCLLPLAAILIQNALPGYAIAYLSIIIAIEVLFFFVNVSKNVQLAEEQEKNKEAQIRIMMSQIQPHFVYNSLSAISTLITIDPEKAQRALDDFTGYLRHNLSSLTETKLIPFEAELQHIETYVSLEKVRFAERVDVVYDIKAMDFYVPPLSIQPIVENAIKHGVLKKIEGGTLNIKTYETEEAYVVEVDDDGVGFDLDGIDFETNEHFGINNIRHRLKTMCNGELAITSEVGKGTKAVITFYK